MYDIGDEEFTLGKEKTVEVPETGDISSVVKVLLNENEHRYLVQVQNTAFSQYAKPRSLVTRVKI